MKTLILVYTVEFPVFIFLKKDNGCHDVKI